MITSTFQLWGLIFKEVYPLEFHASVTHSVHTILDLLRLIFIFGHVWACFWASVNNISGSCASFDDHCQHMSNFEIYMRDFCDATTMLSSLSPMRPTSLSASKKITLMSLIIMTGRRLTDEVHEADEMFSLGETFVISMAVPICAVFMALIFAK